MFLTVHMYLFRVLLASFEKKNAWLCWHGGPESVNQLSSWKSSTNVSQGAVVFLDRVIVSVDGPLTVRPMLSPSYLMVYYVSLNLVKVIMIFHFCLLPVHINGIRSVAVCHELREISVDVSRNLPSHGMKYRHILTRCPICSLCSDIVWSLSFQVQTVTAAIKLSPALHWGNIVPTRCFFWSDCTVADCSHTFCLSKL